MFQIALAAMLGTAPLVRPADPVDPDPASLTVPPDADEKARDLIKQLADPRHPVREEAQREVRDLGRFALPAIQDALASAEVPEVGRRCELLYPRAFALDLKARLDCYTADAAGKYVHHLPGETEFFAVAGRTDAARKLYRDLMLSPNRALVAGVTGPAEDVQAAAALRRAELNPRANGLDGTRRLASAEDVLAILFAESCVPDTGPGGVGVMAPTYLLSQSGLRVALESDPRKEAMQAVVLRWFDTRTDARTITACMNLATTFKLPAVPLARKMLASENATPQQKGQAACKVAQTGDGGDLALLAPLLADEQVSYAGVMVVNGQRQNSPIRVQDTALAMSLLLAKQDPAEYGLKARYATNPNDALKFNYINYHFDDADGSADAARAAALKKWGEWAGKNLKGYEMPKLKAEAKDAPKADPPKEK